MNVVVTGSSGFLASNLIHFLLKKKINIFILTRNKKKFLKIKKKFPQVKSFNKIKKKINFECIYHCASPNDIQSNKSINLSIDGNIKFTYKIMLLVIKFEIKKIIYLSTAQVYGKSLNGYVDEKKECKPLNNYGLFHKFSEDLIKKMIISNKLDTKYIILRLSNIVGTGHFYKKDILRLLPNNICKSIKKSNTAILKSSGKQYRNFLSVYELVNILFLILKNKKISSGIYNVGGKNMSVISLVKKISYYISQHTKIKNVIKTESKIPKISRKLHFSSKKINTLLKIKSKNKTLKNTIINIYKTIIL